MSTVIIEPRTFDEVEAEVELVQLRILTRLEDWSGVFDQIEVWRSKSNPSGPYEELTGPGWVQARIPRGSDGPAVLSVPVGPSVYLEGLGLNVRVDDEEDFVVTFVGPNPVTYANAAAQVTAQGAGRFTAYLTEEADFVLQSTRPGNGAQLQVTGGDAAPLLSLAIDLPENYGRGRDARLTLVKDKEQYDFTDLLGSREYYYKTRFRNSTTNSVSEFSVAFAVGQALGVTPANVVCAYLDLVRSDGRPLANQLVQVYAPVQTALVEEKLVTGARQAKVTDINGHIEFTLVRGVSYTVSITGTDIVREIRAPTDPNVKLFNLLKDGLEDDAFTVQIPDIVYAERRTL